MTTTAPTSTYTGRRARHSAIVTTAAVLSTLAAPASASPTRPAPDTASAPEPRPMDEETPHSTTSQSSVNTGKGARPALGSAASADPAATAVPTLLVRITGAEAKGQIFLSVCTEAEYFVRGGPTCARGTVLDPAVSTQWSVTDAPAGTYIVRGYHDLDGDGALDTKIFGIPAEPTFASNDARGRRGPPSFEDMAFELPPEGLDITLTPIRY